MSKTLQTLIREWRKHAAPTTWGRPNHKARRAILRRAESLGLIDALVDAIVEGR